MMLQESIYVKELSDYKSDWNNLLFRSIDNHPFLTSEWLNSWWKHFGREKELKFFSTQSGNDVSLVIPVMYSTCKVLGSKRRRVSFVADPDSDYQVFLVTNFQQAIENVKQLIDGIIEDSDADCVTFGEVPEDSATSKLLEGINDQEFTNHRSATNLCPYIPLPSSYEIFNQNLGSNMRRNLKVWEKQALKDYKVSFVRYDEIGSVDYAMNKFFDLHQKRELSIGNAGVFSDDIQKQFHLDLAKAFAAKGWLSLFFLTFNDEPVSAIYSFEYNGKIYAYLCGFDPEFSEYRPGNLAFKKLIQHAIENNLREFDFLRGDEEYKSRWKTTVRNNLEFRYDKRGLKSKFFNWNVNGRFQAL